MGNGFMRLGEVLHKVPLRASSEKPKASLTVEKYSGQACGFDRTCPVVEIGGLITRTQLLQSPRLEAPRLEPVLRPVI
ncbi:hypothetical protein GH714_034359 [Hevea brasiliensis]|uniref:Uncharacterized protein n=1 Tax=Hevea brasiliensis TaxID=3981 RepID=A0A6A6M3Z4_HEVBR|nr:hypothetical protein GH714_034359 [Hevea brasiliensis]